MVPCSVGDGLVYQRSVFRFAPLRAPAVRATVQEANYGGYAGGGVPSFCPNSTPLTIETHAIEVYRALKVSNHLQLGTGSPVTATTTQ